MTPLLFATVLLLQQGPMMPQSQDTTAQGRSRQTISSVGLAVGEVRGTLDLFRRAVFNDPDAVVLERAQGLRGKCEVLARLSRAARTSICRTCFHGAQPEIERYRTSLAGLAQMGDRCSRTLTAQSSARNAAGALKRDFRPTSQQILAALVPYEDAVQRVRVALGVAAPPTPPQSAPARRPR